MTVGPYVGGMTVVERGSPDDYNWFGPGGIRGKYLHRTPTKTVRMRMARRERTSGRCIYCGKRAEPDVIGPLCAACRSVCAGYGR